MMVESVRLDDVSVRFVLQHQRSRSFQDALVSLLSGREAPSEEFWVLRGVSFEVREGETVGLIGQNGSGKSTILKLITRILEPTRGKVSVSGRVSALIELGAGFHPDLTGRENIYLNGSILGLSRKEIDGLFAEIVAFSELERFIDTPVKHYSSGMYMRLGFSVATSVDPDILIIDEVLAVGDEAFQRKCLDRIFDFKRRGKTILFVSHGLQVVEQLCDRVIWLHQGVIQEQGQATRTIRSYIRELQEHDERVREVEHAAAEGAPAVEMSSSTLASATVRDVTLLDAQGRERYSFRTGEQVTVRLRFRIPSPAYEYVADLEVRRADGLLITKLTSPRFGSSIIDLNGDGTIEVLVESLPLLAGTYDVTPAVRQPHEGATPLAMNESLRCSFSVWRNDDDAGLVSIPHSWHGIKQELIEGRREPVPVSP